MLSKQAIFEVGVGCAFLGLGVTLLPNGTIGWQLLLVGAGVLGLSALSRRQNHQALTAKAHINKKHMTPKMGGSSRLISEQ